MHIGFLFTFLFYGENGGLGAKQGILLYFIEVNTLARSAYGAAIARSFGRVTIENERTKMSSHTRKNVGTYLSFLQSEKYYIFATFKFQQTRPIIRA